MNIIAIDIGNTNISIGLFVKDAERSIVTVPAALEDADRRIEDALTEAWDQIPVLETSRERRRDGVIVVSSVNDPWTQRVADLARSALDERIYLIGKDVPLPIETGVDEPLAVGTDRLINAAAAFAVLEDACVVADFGTAVTIDLVDEQGVFLGGVIAPGFEMGAQALHDWTDRLPRIAVTPPKDPIGASTIDAINSGLFYSAVGLLRVVTEKFAEQLGRWPHTIVTGGAGRLLREHCDFVDTWIDHLAVRGIVLAYKKALAEKAEIAELDAADQDPDSPAE